MATKKSVVLGQAFAYWPEYHRARARAHILDQWATGRQYDIEVDVDEFGYGRPYIPEAQDTASEYGQLAAISANQWAGLVVKSLQQTAYVDGVRLPDSTDNLEVWATWQRNLMDRKQIALYRAAIGHGAAYNVVMPGKDALTGDKMARWTPRSALRTTAFYDDDDDEWAALAIDALPYQDESGTGWNVTLYDETAEHHLTCKNDGTELKDWRYIDYEEHPCKVTPVALYTHAQDLDGKSSGAIEPIIPILRRIDQTTFDRMIVQRFGAWKVRYIAGMAKPSTQEQANLQALRLKVEDLLISGDNQTKFGTLDATPLDGFIASGDTDLRYLAAITQTPPHHLLGLSSNLQAEALAAAESGLQRLSLDFKMGAGEGHEQSFRLSAIINGNAKEAAAYDMQTRWRDTESRSFMQTVQGLTMAATGLRVPVEMLWEKFPGWTDADVTRAKSLVESGAMDQLFAALEQANPTLDAEQQTGQTRVSSGGSDNAEQ